MKLPDRGFSLVEVTIALGIMAFCIIPIFALLPTGMNAVKDAANRRNAAEAMNSIAAEFLTADRFGGAASHRLAGILTNVTWEVGGAAVTEDFALVGDNPGTEELKGRLEIYPPENRWSSGLALISIAWPASAKHTASGWDKAQGSVHTAVYFNP